MEILLLIICIVFIVGSILLARLLPSKGKVGEKRVANMLNKLPEDKYRILNDVMLRTPKGTSQIDHIVVSIYGIFIIETKFYKGWIFGGENTEYWTQNIYGKNNSFYNPVLQNTGHVRVLKKMLQDFGDLPFFQIVTFSEQAALKINVYNACVVYWCQILPTIRQYSKERLTMSQVNDIYDFIDKIKLDTKEKETNWKHIRNINKTREKKQKYIAYGKCPRCGRWLVLREGKYGKFYGCSDYPKCKFTQEA